MFTAKCRQTYDGRGHGSRGQGSSSSALTEEARLTNLRPDSPFACNLAVRQQHMLAAWTIL